MDKVSLQKRKDTKYLVPISALEEFLKAITHSHRILRINEALVQNYKTFYYDTPMHEMYIAHHNKKGNRYKIRVREYIESHLFFLEIKNKSNKGKTSKKRLKLNSLSIENSKKTKEFIDTNSPFCKEDILPVLGNTFSRITLVDNDLSERITIDQNLEAWVLDSDKRIHLPHIAIIELKQDMYAKSNTHQKLRDLRIFPTGFSKYAIASSLLFAEKLKNNNFKKKQRVIQKVVLD